MDNQEVLTKLSTLIERLQQGAGSAPPSGFGLPQATLMSTGYQPAGPLTNLPQPTGVSVPVTVPLPDGREVSFRVHFGPEAAANLQALAMACAAAFGPYLQTRQPFASRSWNGYSGYNGRRRY